MRTRLQKLRAFTLMEVLIVIILIGIMAVFGIPQYTKSLSRSKERDTIIQLYAIHAANAVYKANTGSYITGTFTGIATINNDLKLNVLDNGMTYSYNGTANAFTITAQHPTEQYTIRLTQDPLKQDYNPCCGDDVKACPSLMQADWLNCR